MKLYSIFSNKFSIKYYIIGFCKLYHLVKIKNIYISIFNDFKDKK